MSHSPLNVVFAIALLIVVVPADAIAAEVSPDQIDAIFSDFDRSDSPGCSLGVIRDGELIYKRGYGMANLEYGLALTPRSVLRIGSTSKQFTAMAILLLAREGKIDLDADIRDYLPALTEYETPVTIRHLIHHTSGYRDYLSLMALSGLRDDDFVTDEQVLDLLAQQKELNFEPGTQHLYSNSGYFLLSQIVKSVAGKSLREHAHERIFEPLAMSSTHFHDDHTHIVKDRATGYAPLEEGGYRISVTTLDMVGDGGVFTSVEDLLLWDRNFYANKLGGARLLEEYLTPGALVDGERLTYAFGLMVTKHRGLRRISHGGAFVGYRAEMIRFPEQKLSVICLCNRSDADPDRRAQKVADLYLADAYPTPAAGMERETPAAAPGEAPEAAEAPAVEAQGIDLPQDVLASRVGAYKSREEPTVVKVELEDGRLFYVWPYGRFRMTALSPSRFKLIGLPVDVDLRFEEPPGGASPILHVRVGIDLAKATYDPVELARLSPEQVAEYGGRYRCEELRTTLHLESEGATLRARHDEPFRQEAEKPFEPTLRDTFASGGLVLEFGRDERGRLTGFRLHADRVKNLRCDRK
jgi:CubicO group peptidase (beta-lactamase class C family)